MNNTPKVYFALPVMDESDNLSQLLSDIEYQDYQNIALHVCVNQYNHWWNEDDKLHICSDNAKSLEILSSNFSFPTKIIDKSSPNNGWHKKKGGVGHARKVIMDDISQVAKPTDIIISIDADTRYPKNYVTSIVEYFQQNKKSLGLAIPYYHKSDNLITKRLILRYEIYMRYYLINMLRIKNPFAFTAIGSAMACTAGSYKKVGGLTPVMSGEDFYFLQKLAKSGTVGIWCNTLAYPSSRFSDRVLFGTGPALIKGNNGDWDSYPIYHYKFFDQVEKTYSQFADIFDNKNPILPMEEFLRKQFNQDNLWEPIKNNYKDVNNFVRGCQNKADALRILQFLRSQQNNISLSDEEILVAYLQKYYSNIDLKNKIGVLDNLSFEHTNIDIISRLRDLLFDIEMKTRKEFNNGIN